MSNLAHKVFPKKTKAHTALKLGETSFVASRDARLHVSQVTSRDRFRRHF